MLTHSAQPENTAPRAAQPVPTWLQAVSAVAAVVGIAAAALGVQQRPLSTWLYLVANFLYFMGLAQGIVTWAVIFRVAQARWTPAFSRFGRAGLAFAPVSMLLFIPLCMGRETYLVWIRHPLPEKLPWLSAGFFFARNAIGLALLFLISWYVLRIHQQGQRRWGSETPRWGQADQQLEQISYRLTAVGIAYLILFAFVFTVVAMDFVQSLMPTWYSTLIGGYFFIGDLYLSIATLIFMAALLRRRMGLDRFLGPEEFQNAGNLLLGFGVFTTGLFWAQFLTIWYENKPVETQYLIPRFYSTPWHPVSWAILVVALAIPFLLLQSRELKRTPSAVAVPAAFVIVGMWMERVFLVVPSLLPGELGFGAAPALMTVGFVGALILALSVGLKWTPPASPLDLALKDVPKLEL